MHNIIIISVDICSTNTPWRILLQKHSLIQLFKKFPTSHVQSESALPPGHKRLELDLTLSKFSLIYILTKYFLKTHFNSTFPCLRSPKLPLSFKILWQSFLMCFSDIIHFIWSSLVRHSDEHKLWHSLLYNCLCPVTSSDIEPNTLISICFHTLSIYEG